MVLKHTVFMPSHLCQPSEDSDVGGLGGSRQRLWLPALPVDTGTSNPLSCTWGSGSEGMTPSWLSEINAFENPLVLLLRTLSR